MPEKHKKGAPSLNFSKIFCVRSSFPRNSKDIFPKNGTGNFSDRGHLCLLLFHSSDLPRRSESLCCLHDALANEALLPKVLVPFTKLSNALSRKRLIIFLIALAILMIWLSNSIYVNTGMGRTMDSQGYFEDTVRDMTLMNVELRGRGLEAG